LVVVPSWAVTTTVIGVSPTLRLRLPEGLPEATGVPFTVTVAPLPATVGVTVRLVTPLATLAV
jgi:hypothetical protein